MIEFINAKINIGLQIVGRREDGYHDLQTIFYPVGKFAGLPVNPEPFCDILEIRDDESGMDVSYEFSGRLIDCAPEKNLVVRAASLFLENVKFQKGRLVRLEKHIPDGAGLGGGSADASFTLKAMNSMSGNPMSPDELARLALKLGADCPFFIYNTPKYASGVGEKMEDIALDLSHYWIVIVKPKVYISTKEAFAGVVPRKSDFDLRCLPSLPIEKWHEVVENDFEESVFPSHPELPEIKQQLLSDGAVYASMSGSGSSIFGIFKNVEIAQNAKTKFQNHPTIEGVYLLKL